MIKGKTADSSTFGLRLRQGFDLSRKLGTVGLLCFLSLASIPALCQPIRVVSYNIWGLPTPLLRHGERFDEIPAAVNGMDADIVLIQEAFTDKARRLAELPNFPYHAWGPRGRFLRFSSGLLILSRFPIEEIAMTTYSRCGGFDCFANKGAMYAKIQVPGLGPVSVFNTHLNANGHEGPRASQAAHLMRFVKVYSQGLPTIVGGDFNGEGRSLLQRIGQASLLRDAHAEFLEEHPAVSTSIRFGFTADPKRNPFLGRSETQRRLDHIFLMDPSGRQNWKIIEDGLVQDGERGKVLSDHFGVRVVADVSP